MSNCSRPSVQYFVGGPMQFEPTVQYVPVKPECVGPLGHGTADSIMLNHLIFASVVGLFAVCCPVAIVGRVADCVVAPFEGMPFARTWTHIGVEVFERVPSLTDRYPSAAVSRIASEVRIFAALKDRKSTRLNSSHVWNL